MIQIKTFVCNPYQQNTYVVHAEGERACVLVDAGMYSADEQQAAAAYLNAHHLQAETVLLTHSHPDHVCGLQWLTATYKPEVISAKTLQDDDNLHLTRAGMEIDILHTPGHKEDCLCFRVRAAGDERAEKTNELTDKTALQEEVLFTGDTLFRQSVGRTDLEGGDWGTLMQSLQQLMSLPDNLTVYPGHGDPTTIGYERKYNPYV